MLYSYVICSISLFMDKIFHAILMIVIIVKFHMYGEFILYIIAYSVFRRTCWFLNKWKIT